MPKALVSFRDQLSRVEMMAEDRGETWDLSDNDQAALKAVLGNRRYHLTGMRRLIADDGFAMQFQTMGQYRTALLRSLDDATRDEK